MDSEIININDEENYDNYQLKIENWFHSLDIDKHLVQKNWQTVLTP